MPRRRQARTVTGSTSRTAPRSAALGQSAMTSAKLVGGGEPDGLLPGLLVPGTGCWRGDLSRFIGRQNHGVAAHNKTCCIGIFALHKRVESAT